MIKQVWIAQCDLCGKVDIAKIRGGQYNETNCLLPEGWTYGYNKDIHICEECYRKTKAKELPEIKSCVCGSKPTIFYNDFNKQYSLVCTNCGRMAINHSEKTAIDEWNRRCGNDC